MHVSLNTRQAYSEIDEFLELLNEAKRNEIPQRLRKFFKEEKDREYIKNINPNNPIKDQNFKEETLAIIAFLNLRYWCKDEEEKDRLKAIYAQNERNYKNMLYEKYNPNDIFKEKKEIVPKNNIRSDENVQIIQYKESVFRRTISRILKIIKFGK